MKALSAEDVADLRRWLISGAVIVLAHGAIAAGMVNWRDEIEPGEPAAAIVIEFAPLPVAPAAPQIDIACVCRKPRPFDLMKESRNVGHDGRAALLPFEAVGFAVQVDQPA